MSWFTRLSQLSHKLVDYSRFLARTRHDGELGWYVPRGKSRIVRSQFLHGQSRTWFVHAGSLRVPLAGEDDLDTIIDVVDGNHYGRLVDHLPSRCVVLDIGANIGFASLCFANDPRVAHVYAFEPMPETFACAEHTLQANPAVARKITLAPVGVGGSDRTLEIEFVRKVKCAAGISGLPERLREHYHVTAEDISIVPLHLKDATAVCQEVRASYPGVPIALKIDAEGAEYEILERLLSSGVLSDLHSLAIEWHGAGGGAKVETTLQAAGFTTSAKQIELDDSIGMVDAWHEDAQPSSYNKPA